MKSKIYCLFHGHNWNGGKICTVCGKKAVGLPKYDNPPAPPKRNNN